MKATINRIIQFSNVDGPGNRLSIFFQSCPFHCAYCHNPETINMCVHCGVCVEQCPAKALSIENSKVIWNPSKCVECDTCIKVCPHFSSPKTKQMSVEDCLVEIKKVEPFIRGITCSGGECMNHADFMLELFKEVKKLNLTCLIDSNGYYDFSNYPELMSVCDGVMLDVKAFDRDFHQQLTQQDNHIVLKNLHWLLEQNKLEEVRTVLLPNHLDQNRVTVSEVSKILNHRSRYKLIKYRPYGVTELGKTFCGNQTLSDNEAKLIEKIALKYTNNVNIT